MKLKAIHKRRLLKLAKFLREKVAPADSRLDYHNGIYFRLFDMSVYLVSGDYDKPDVYRASIECGTPACAAGWATAVFQELTYSPRHKHFHINYKCQRDNFHAITRFFGIGESTHALLFGTTQRTPREEARLIEQTVKRLGGGQ